MHSRLEEISIKIKDSDKSAVTAKSSGISAIAANIATNPVLPEEIQKVVVLMAGDAYLQHFCFALPAESLRDMLRQRNYTDPQIELACETVHMLAYISLGSSLNTLSIPLISYLLNSMTGMKSSYANAVACVGVYGYDYLTNPVETAAADLTCAVSLIAGGAASMFGRVTAKSHYCEIKKMICRFGLFTFTEDETEQQLQCALLARK